MATRNSTDKNDEKNNNKQGVKSIVVKVSITPTLKISGDRSKPKKPPTVRTVVNDENKFFIAQFSLQFRYYVTLTETLFIEQYKTFELQFFLVCFLFCKE
jgi:uncharacterized alpha/beta hydrolase family protein